VSCAAVVDDGVEEWFVRFSNFDRMLSVVTYMRRFVQAFQQRVALRRSGVSRPSLPLSSDRIFTKKIEFGRYYRARALAAESQRVHFSELLRKLVAGSRISSKPVARLAPFIDSDGVIRVGYDVYDTRY